MKFTPEQRAAWRENTTDDAFNRWLNPQAEDTTGALDLDKVNAVAMRYSDINRARWAHLNFGLQRMNVGNILRRGVPASECDG